MKQYEINDIEGCNFRADVESPMRRLSMGESFLLEKVMVREVVNRNSLNRKRRV